MNLGKSRDCTQRKSSRSLPVLLSIKRLSAATSVSHLKIVMLLLLISYPLSLINATNLLFSYTLSAYLRGSLTNVSILIIGIEYDSLPAPGRGTMAQSQRPIQTLVTAMYIQSSSRSGMLCTKDKQGSVQCSAVCNQVIKEKLCFFCYNSLLLLMPYIRSRGARHTLVCIGLTEGQL